MVQVLLVLASMGSNAKKKKKKLRNQNRGEKRGRLPAKYSHKFMVAKCSIIWAREDHKQFYSSV